MGLEIILQFRFSLPRRRDEAGAVAHLETDLDLWAMSRQKIQISFGERTHLLAANGLKHLEGHGWFLGGNLLPKLKVADLAQVVQVWVCRN